MVVDYNSLVVYNFADNKEVAGIAVEDKAAGIDAVEAAVHMANEIGDLAVARIVDNCSFDTEKMMMVVDNLSFAHNLMKI